MRLVSTLLLAVVVASGQVSVGSRVSSIEIVDAGKPVSISPAAAQATVVIFTSTQCPISNSYNERLNDLHNSYTGQKVRFVFVNSNANESPDEVDQHAKANRFSFKIYKDAGNVLADKLGATVTPEAFIFDSGGTLQYHGFIDDAANPARVQVRGARKAIDALLAGKPVELKEARSFGCTIKRVRKPNT